MRCIVCPECKYQNLPDAWFCVDCGEALTIRIVIETDNVIGHHELLFSKETALQENMLKGHSTQKDNLAMNKITSYRKTSTKRTWETIGIMGLILFDIFICMGLGLFDSVPPAWFIFLIAVDFLLFLAWL